MNQPSNDEHIEQTINQSDGVALQNKKRKKTAEATQQPYPTMRIGLREFVELIESLDNTKLDAVRDMGFGELIKLKALQSLNLKVLELMHQFDENSSTLDVHGERLVLTEVEVSRILGLPVGGVNIQSIKCSVAKMNTKYGLKPCGIIRKDLVKELKTTPVDDKWKATLILCV